MTCKRSKHSFFRLEVDNGLFYNNNNNTSFNLINSRDFLSFMFAFVCLFCFYGNNQYLFLTADFEVICYLQIFKSLILASAYTKTLSWKQNSLPEALLSMIFIINMKPG